MGSVASKTASKIKNMGVKYCPTHKSIRLKALYKRGTRQEGQPFVHVGYACPVCQYHELDNKVLVGTL